MRLSSIESTIPHAGMSITRKKKHIYTLGHTYYKCTKVPLNLTSTQGPSRDGVARDSKERREKAFEANQQV